MPLATRKSDCRSFTSVASTPREPMATGAPGGEELVDLLDRRREVGVGHEDVLARGLEDAGPHGGPLAAVLGQADHAEGEAEAGGGLLGDGGRPVRGAVVDDEDLGREAAACGSRASRRSARGRRGAASPRCRRE